MKIRPFILALILPGVPWASAQKVALEPQEDPVQAAIREFNSRDLTKTNEVSVILPPSEEPIVLSAPAAEPAADKQPKEPVLVTGTAPADSQLVEDATNPMPPATEEPPPEPRQGLAVSVEKLHIGQGEVDPAKVKLRAPFPAKPLAEPPASWHLEASEHAPPFTREVSLAPGKTITLTIRPHLLVPAADGVTAFSISEPGFDSALGYRQDATVGAVLSNAVRQLDEDAIKLGSAIDKLQQLLVSLPRPESAPEPAPAAPTEPTTKRK
jgi:hypothetical protein